MRLSNRLKPALMFATLVALWEGTVRLFAIHPLILPAPSAAVLRLFEIPSQVLDATLITLSIVFSGFGLAVVLGSALAAMIVHSRFLAETLYPLLVVTQVTPQVAVAPILVIWFGGSSLPKVLVAFLVAFFPMVVNTATGLMRVSEELIDLMKGLRASRWRIFWMIRLPNAMPYIFAGMRISITLAVIGTVVAEFVIGGEGLGFLVFNGQLNADTAMSFGAIMILMGLGISLFLVVGWLRRLALPWAREAQEGEA